VIGALRSTEQGTCGPGSPTPWDDLAVGQDGMQMPYVSFYDYLLSRANPTQDERDAAEGNTLGDPSEREALLELARDFEAAGDPALAWGNAITSPSSRSCADRRAPAARSAAWRIEPFGGGRSMSSPDVRGCVENGPRPRRRAGERSREFRLKLWLVGDGGSDRSADARAAWIAASALRDLREDGRLQCVLPASRSGAGVPEFAEAGENHRDLAAHRREQGSGDDSALPVQ